MDNISWIEKVDPEIADCLKRELKRQEETLVLIPSENYASPAVLQAQGCIMTNKYAEGYPRRRYYNGCQFVDEVEELACTRAKELFHADHVNVQPHSGSQANMAGYLALLKPGDTVLAMEISHGGHLTHGREINFSGQFYRFCFYGVDPETEVVDLDQVRDLARKHCPKMIVVGASSYPRSIDFAPWRQIADEVGAYLLADVAHVAGLVVAGLHPDPIPYADIVTTTTHKTLRGPRGAIIMCKGEHKDAVDKAVFPGTQGGPLMHIIAAKAVAFKEAMTEEFRQYQAQVVSNTRTLAQVLAEEGFRIISGGTDNHLFLVDLRDTPLTGKDAANILEEAGITVNKNVIPFDPRPPWITSGIRLGAPAITTRGMKEEQMQWIAKRISLVLKNPSDEELRAKVRDEVKELCRAFPIYNNL